MRQSPHELANDLKEVLCTYLETAYRISHPAVARDRAKLLREPGVVGQIPYVETTPRFKAGGWLGDLDLPWLPDELPDLARFGLPTSKFPLFSHQEGALRAAWAEDGSPRDLIVASGTGSGKTECFYLPILADILREALQWQAATETGSVGRWDGKHKAWLHGRRHEARPAAVRALVLYPMNALVNDQLRRLRKTLASDGALAWQRDNLANNLIYFGRYTSQTKLAGRPEQRSRRENWEEYRGQVEADWGAIGEELRRSGGWPRPEGAEMLSRWDMQAAPPDVLITNYSMLEYMLVRPIEAAIFDRTREWLAASEENVLTLVLDEAHTYTGARGTEVAYLIRRLFERLEVGPEQVRCVATSASLGDDEASLRRVRRFAADLFAHPEKRFTVVRAEVEPEPEDLQGPTTHELEAFEGFQRSLEEEGNGSGADEDERVSVAATRLFDDLEVAPDGGDVSARLHRALETHPRILDLRRRTARRATDFGAVADAVWGEVGTPENRRAATAGLLSAGAYARPSGAEDPDVPPLVPSRMHLMFRGLPGIWACMNPRCPGTHSETAQEERPCGRIYGYPRVWCEEKGCGARVLELFSCRVCGLLFLGGIADEAGRLWPYEQDLEGGLQDYDRYEVVAVENPNRSGSQAAWAEERRSIYTTAAVDPSEKGGLRTTWVRTKDDGSIDAHRPQACPRCNAHRSPARHVIEPLRTTGRQSLTVLVEQAFRSQAPRGADGAEEEISAVSAPSGGGGWLKKKSRAQVSKPPVGNPNRGRKALVFSDGRQDAATLAGDLSYFHARDLFRQLLMLVLDEGSGGPIAVHDLRRRVFDAAVRRGIDPSVGEVENFWSRYDVNPKAVREEAEPIVDVYLRREIADREVSVEALGLARWTLDPDALEVEQIPPLGQLDRSETLALLHATLRILAGENVLLPKELDPEAWHHDLIDPYLRRTVLRPPSKDKNSFIWDPNKGNRLTRYLGAVAEEMGLGPDGLPRLMGELWDGYLGHILPPVAGNRSGWGLPIETLALASLPERIFVCGACGYLSAETVLGVCLRCQGACDEASAEEVAARRRNYYRDLAGLATAGGEHPDPFPLKALEHTAQISTTDAAARERHFQDRFIPKTENPQQDRVDVLSVTTTMEMGIDIGDLTLVALQNTPPTVANYQQRAGRAGRRSDGVAQVLTFARDRSHDQYYFSRVKEIVSGPVRVPEVHLDNEVIARRHVQALSLQRYFHDRLGFEGGSNLFGAFGDVGGFLADDSPGTLADLRSSLAGGGFREGLEAAARRVVTEATYDVGGWLDALAGEAEAALENVHEEEDLLSTLITRGLLPRYAFPVDLVSMWTKRPSRYSRGEEVQRDLQIALSEYAPEAEVVIDGRIYRSAGLYVPFDEDPNYQPDSWFYECPECRAVRVAERGAGRPDWRQCATCGIPITGAPRYRILPAIRPQGFRTDWAKPSKKYRGGGRDRSGFATTAQLHAGETASSGEPRCSGRLWVHHRSGELFMVNRGSDDEPGFWICPRCGRNLKKKNEQHKRLGGGNTTCGGRAGERAALLHRFNSDVAILAVDLPAGMEANLTSPSGKGAWWSFGFALLRAAATRLQIDTGELAVGVRPWRHPDERLLGEVFLFDTLPNGAGYAEEVAAEIEQILGRALDLCANCPGRCETACYRCLMDYGNQRQHALLDRHLAADLLRYALEGKEPELPPERGKHALERLRYFCASDHTLTLDAVVEGKSVPGLLEMPGGQPLSLWPLHTLSADSGDEATDIAIETGTDPVFVTEFDLNRRPFRVWNNILQGRRGRL